VGPLVDSERTGPSGPSRTKGRPEVAVASGIEVGLQGPGGGPPTPPLGSATSTSHRPRRGGWRTVPGSASSFAERLQPALRAFAAAHERRSMILLDVEAASFPC